MAGAYLNQLMRLNVLSLCSLGMICSGLNLNRNILNGMCQLLYRGCLFGSSLSQRLCAAGHLSAAGINLVCRNVNLLESLA